MGISIVKSEITRYDSIDWANLGFGKFFSDHMFISIYDGTRWDDGKIIPYGPISYEPSMMTLHYGQTIFEGLKAYYNVKGGINLFRPDMNAKRMNSSAERLCIPLFDEKKFVEAIIELVKLDQKFVPRKKGESLYIRPVCFGSSCFLGVHPSKEYTFIIITSPVASYYPEGLNPVKILIVDEYVRAVRGGLGMAKTAANYAASLYAGMKAKEKGFSQVLWLDGIQHEFVDEVGAMNIMFVIDDVLITPPLSQGSILPGVTRDSVLKLARDMGIKVQERSIKIQEVLESYEVGTLQEVFGTGTAATISPVGKLYYKDKEMIINNNQIGPIAQKMYDTLTGIQHGEIEDKYNWIVHIEI
ncbi:MAG: branched-chain amino acid aminotransferase [Ignavibacteria bacterium]|nr:branched-chain amino acid aminotransferase [Ignavibacteria bacterium]